MAKKNKKNYRGKAAIPDPTTVSKALPTPIYSTLVLTPPRREINDIGNWKSALRAADIGIRFPLYDLYSSIMLDGSVTDAINKRIEARLLMPILILSQKTESSPM